jgi:hypothetical protein
MALSGDIKNYELGLIKRFGKKEGQRIIDYCEGPHNIKSWTGPELKKFRALCSKKIRELEAYFEGYAIGADLPF